VIIPAYDDTPKLRRAMWSIQQTADMPYELIISRAKQCVAKNRNAGLALATQDLVIFLDDDVLLPPGWMSRLVAVLGAHRDYGAVCAHLTFADGSPQTRRPDLSPGEFWEITIPGTCFVYSRARVHDIPFDENYQGSQWEDTDWMWQVGRQGLKVGMTGDVWVLHDHADSENKWLFPNAEYFRTKWGELPAEDDNVSVSPEGYAGWSQPPLPGTDALESEPQQEGEWGSRKDRDDES
jgi:glycosyltransferase involved in cell wall biosynthesis